MNKREVVIAALTGKEVPYVPWSFGFTAEAAEKLAPYTRSEGLIEFCGNHCMVAYAGLPWTELTGERVRDPYGVVWNRSVDKDIGIVEGTVLQSPTLKGYTFPSLDNAGVFGPLENIASAPRDKFLILDIGFSLYERAWTLRGMENVLTDFYLHPDFMHELLDAICDHNIEQVRRIKDWDFDAVQFGDDWGQQKGLQMGIDIWRTFIKPRLKRMYSAVKESGRFVMIHSCGKVDELFDDLIDIGVNCFNPFQPEVMDTEKLLNTYRGRLSFYGGLSTQKVLPYSTADEVRAETRRLLTLGKEGGYILSPAHAVEGDVPVENMLAFIEEAKGQLCTVC